MTEGYCIVFVLQKTATFDVDAEPAQAPKEKDQSGDEVKDPKLTS